MIKTVEMLEDARRMLKIAVECLTKIKNEDYRGNRSQSSVDAFKALEEIDKILNKHVDPIP